MYQSGQYTQESDVKLASKWRVDVGPDVVPMSIRVNQGQGVTPCTLPAYCRCPGRYVSDIRSTSKICRGPTFNKDLCSVSIAIKSAYTFETWRQNGLSKGPCWFFLTLSSIHCLKPVDTYLMLIYGILKTSCHIQSMVKQWIKHRPLLNFQQGSCKALSVNKAMLLVNVCKSNLLYSSLS